MNLDFDLNEQKNLLPYKLLGDQMAFLELGIGQMKNNNNNYGNEDMNKTKIKLGKINKIPLSQNKLDNRNNYLKNKNSFNDSDNNQRNINNNPNNNPNNDINNSKKNRNTTKNRSNTVRVTNPIETNKNNIIEKPRNTKLLGNDINFSDKYQYNQYNDSFKKNVSNDNETISNDFKNIPATEIVEIRKISTEDFEEESNKSFNIFSLDKRILSKARQYSIYERSIKNMKKKETKIGKEVAIKTRKILAEFRPNPDMNKKSQYLVLKRGKYIPLENRAVQIHSQHLTQVLLNEEKKRREKEYKEEKAMNEKIYKKYEPKEWEEFVQKCFQWKEDISYKRKAAEIYRDKLDKKINYKPRINENSKKIMKKMSKRNPSVDDVFTRLYHDYDDHRERQKELEDKNLPSFYPKINNFKYQKIFEKNKKYRNNSYDNSYERFITDESKNNFFLDSQITINDGKLRNKKKRVLKYINKAKIENSKEDNINYNKSYKPTQTSNQTVSYMNTDININKNKYKKYLYTDNNNITTETNLYTNQYNIPTDINPLTEENKIIDEINENNNIYLNNNNNYFESIEEYEDKNNQNVQNNQNNNEINNECTFKRYNIKDKNYEERILKELNEAKMLNKERMEKENSEEYKNNDSLYKINIMETTPENLKQNVIVPSNKYQDFFDIEEINEL